MNGNQTTNVQFLNGISKGILPSGGACPPAVQLVAPTGSCATPQTIQPTAPSNGIDPLALLNQRCGTTSFPFTNDATNSTLARWVLSGDCIETLAPFLFCNDDVVLSTDSPTFISTQAPFSGGNGSSDKRTAAFRCVTEGFSSIMSDLTFKGPSDSIDLMADAQMVQFNINPWDQFGVCKEEVDQDNCSQCITTNGNNQTIHWTSGLVALSDISGFFIDVPAGVRGKFQVCFVSRAIALMVPCGSVPVNCAVNY